MRQDLFSRVSLRQLTLYLCPLVVVTGHRMDITDQSLQGKNTDISNSAVLH